MALLAIAALLGCAGESEREASAEANRELVRRLYEEVFNEGNLAVVDEIVGANFLDHNPEYGFPPDREGLRQITAAFDTFFPDNHITAEDWIVEGDKVVTRVTFRGTHEGEFAGILPTGRQVVISGFDIHRVEGGKIVERWGLFDALSLMTQLGAISLPEGSQ